MSSAQASRNELNPSVSRRSFQDSSMLLHSSASLDKPQTSAATINNYSLSGAASNKINLSCNMPLQNTTSDAIPSCVEYVQSVPNIFSNSRSFAFPRSSVSAAHSKAISSCVKYVQSVPNISLTSNSNFEPKTVLSTTHNSRRSFAFPRSSVSAAHSNFDSDQFHSEIFKQPVTNNLRSNRVHFNDLSDSFNHFYIQPNVSRPSANYNLSIPMTNSSSQSAHFPHFTPPYPPVGSFINPFQNQQLPLEVLSRHLLQQDLLKEAVEPFDGTAIKFWPWFTKMEGFIQ